MATPAQSTLGFYWFIPFFIGLWLSICCLISLIGGWHLLAQKFHRRQPVDGKSFSFASMVLRRGFFPTHYNGCLSISFDSAGIAISIFPLWRFFHPPLFVSWSAVSECKQERYFFMNVTAVYVAESDIRMQFRGRLGKEIYEFYGPRTRGDFANASSL